MENSSVPPEVLAQAAAAADGRPDEQDDDQIANQPSPFGANVSDPQSGSGPSDVTNALAGQDTIGGGEGGSNSPTLNLKEQLKLLSPMGIIHALIFGEPSQEQKQADQEREARLQQQIAASQQRWQQESMAAEQKKAALREEIESIKAQAQGLRHLDSESVLEQRTTQQPGGDELQLAQRALEDASHQEAKHRQQGLHVPQGTHKGPVDFGTLAKQKSGMQKASEMPMGE